MKMRVVSLGFLWMSFMHAQPVKVPNWVDHVNCILEGMRGIELMLLDDTQLYATWNKALEGMFSDFERRNADRANLFNTVREKISLLQSHVALSEADKASQLEDNEITIRELQGTIAEIRQDAQQEVARLNMLVETLQEQITQAREAYAMLVNLDGDEAQALISELMAIKHAYSGMIDERTLFIATLDRFVKRTHAFLAKSGNDMQDLDVELVGHVNEDAVPATDYPAFTSDDLDEDEMNESEMAYLQ